MAVTINGTTGVAGVDGSASTPAVQGGDTNTGVFFPAADTVAVSTNGTERMRVDSSGNVGIGVTPSQKLDVGGSSQPIIRAISSSTNNATARMFTDGDTAYFGSQNTTTTGGNIPVVFQISGTESARISSGGEFLVGTTGVNVSGMHSMFSIGSTPAVLFLRNSGAAAGKSHYIGPDANQNFLIYNQSSTGVYMAVNGTSWTANSDERYKTPLIPFQNALEKVTSLRSGTGRYLNDTENVSRSFLIAQDVQKVLPEAVDATNPEKIGLSYTDVIPLLVAAIQELKTEVDSLKAKLATTKNA